MAQSVPARNRRSSKRAKILIVLLLVFIAACITSIDNVFITGVFRDPAGTQEVNPSDVYGTVYVGAHVDFSYNPTIGEDNPPHPQDRIQINFAMGTDMQHGWPIGGILDTTLYADGNYVLWCEAYPTGLFDTGYLLSGPFPITINNGGHQNQLPVVSAPPAPGPLDGPDGGAPPPAIDLPPPPTCSTSDQGGNTVAAACGLPNPDPNAPT